MIAYKTSVKKNTFRYIEGELYAYKDTVKEIKRLREQIIHDKEEDENSGGSPGNLPGDPTGMVATKLATHKTLQKMVEMVDAIDSTYEQVGDEHRAVIDIKYFGNHNLYWDDVAYKLSMHRNTVFKYRKEFIIVLANKLGVW